MRPRHFSGRSKARKRQFTRTALNRATTLGGSIRLEQFLQIRHRPTLRLVLSGVPLARAEILAAIGAIRIEYSLGAALATGVVGGGIVVRAIETGMQVCPAAVAGISKANRLAGRQGNFSLARMTLHAASVLQKRRVCQRSAEGWRSSRAPLGRSCAFSGFKAIEGPSLVSSGTGR